MLALLILAAVVVVAAFAVLFSRRMTRDDEHSVAGYHRQLHTLEQIKTHSADGEAGEAQTLGAKPSYPESAVRLSGSPYVRVTDGPNATPPPAVPPPPVADIGGVLTFDDAAPVVVPSGRSSSGVETFSFGRKDRAMDSMNRRPRRLGGPISAVAVVLVLIVVLVIAGSHQVKSTKHHGATTATTNASAGTGRAKKHVKPVHVSTTTTTAVPLVSLPTATSLNDANYTTSLTNYSLVVSATNGPCYVQVDDVTTGTAMYAAVMAPGQQETIAVHGPISIDVGAPANFMATVNGDAVVLPYGYRTPFNLHLAPVGFTGSSTSSTTTTSTLPG